MDGLYSADSFSLGVIIGFFLTLVYTGESMETELFKQNKVNITRQVIYARISNVTIFLCIIAGAYIFYKEYTIFVGYFAALLAGAIIGQIYVIIFSLIGKAGRWIIYATGGLSAFATAYVVWLYYNGEFLQKIGNIDLLKYLPGA